MNSNPRVINVFILLLCIIVLTDCTPTPTVEFTPTPFLTILPTPPPSFEATTIATQQPISPRVTNWQETLSALTEALTRFTNDDWGSETTNALISATTTLKNSIPQYNDQEMMVAIMQLIAQFGHAQTVLNWQTFPGFERVYPFRLTWFDYGLYVTETTVDHRALLGMQLIQIDKIDILTAQQRVRSLISYPDVYAIYAQTPVYLVTPGVLYGLHILPELEAGTFTFAEHNGYTHTIHLTPVSPNTVTWESAAPLLDSSEVLPRATNYWFEYWNHSKTLYLQYNQCEPLVGLPFEAMITDLAVITDQYPVSRFIVDLRDNAGGDENLVQPLIHYLWQRPELNQVGRVFALIGPRTLGAGIQTAALLWEQTAAIVVSEPMPPITDRYATAEVISLPYWNLMLWHTGAQGIRTFQPDYFVLPSAQAYFAGRDPIVYALDHTHDTMTKQSSLAIHSKTSPQHQALTRVEYWQQDLNALTEIISLLPEIHPGAFVTVSSGAFTQNVNELSQSVQVVEDHKIVVGIMRLLTMLGDAHTRVPYWEWEAFQATRYPIEIQHFSDGIYVIAAQSNYTDLIGLQVTHVGEKELSEVYTMLRSIVTHENEHGFKANSPTYMERPVILHALGLTENLESAKFTFADATGKAIVRHLPSINSTVIQTDWVSAVPTSQLPLYLQQPLSVYYWYTYLNKENAIYFQYNVCDEMENRPYNDFIEEMFATAATHPDVRFIVDLRRNEGGYSQYLAPFFTALQKHPELKQEGRLFVLTSGRTFSTAVFMTGLLRAQTEAILIGEPTAQGPNFYASYHSFTLPNSGLVIHYPTMYWQTSEENALTIEPDIEVRISSIDYLAGNDPVLLAALAYRP